MEEKDIILELDSTGFIMYSDFAVKHLKNGEDYLSDYYSDPKNVAKEVNAGQIVGLCTVMSGKYILRIRKGYPCDELRDNTKIKQCLHIKVRGGCIYIRDLYDLVFWEDECTDSQTIKIEDGYYTILLVGNKPNSGWYGDNQIIYVHFIRNEQFAETEFKGIPYFMETGKRANHPLLKIRTL